MSHGFFIRFYLDLEKRAEYDKFVAEFTGRDVDFEAGLQTYVRYVDLEHPEIEYMLELGENAKALELINTFPHTQTYQAEREQFFTRDRERLGKQMQLVAAVGLDLKARSGYSNLGGHTRGRIYEVTVPQEGEGDFARTMTTTMALIQNGYAPGMRVLAELQDLDNPSRRVLHTLADNDTAEQAFATGPVGTAFVSGIAQSGARLHQIAHVSLYTGRGVEIATPPARALTLDI